MIKDDILRMGLEADDYANREWDTETLALYWKQHRDEHFAALVRNECALICDRIAHEWECLANEHSDGGRYNGKAESCRECANDIRATMKSGIKS